MRSRGGERRACAVRDLIEAGLNEPADAATDYGISAARPVPSERLGCCNAAMTVKTRAKGRCRLEAIDAPDGISR